MDPSVRTKGTFLNEDQRWLYGGREDGPNLDIILDRSGFDLVTAFPNGFIPSGVALAEVAATGLYIPYVNQTNPSYSVTVDATSGTWTITVEGDTSAAVAFNVSAANLRTAIENLPGVNAGDVTVTGGPGASGGGTPYVVTFVAGQYAGTAGPVVSVADVDLAGGGDAVAVVATAGGVTTPAGEAIGRGLLFASVPYDRDSTGDISAALCRDATVIESLLPTGHGVDAAFKADCPHLKWI
jgi:hypothetical protein